MPSFSLARPKPRRLIQSLLLINHCSSHIPSTRTPSQDQDLLALISDIVLSHSGDAESLSLSLNHRFPGGAVSWPPDIIDRVLKRLWNDGPRALLFFHALLHHQSPSFRPAPSSVDHAIDIAARLRDHRAVSRLLFLRPPTPRTFAVLAERYAAAGKPDRAVRIFLSMHRRGCPQDVHSFNTLLDVLCKSRRVEKAESLFRALRCRFPADVVSYNILADGWCRMKRTSKAMAVLKEMVESGIEPRMTTYNILLKGFFRAGQVREAWRFFTQMKKRGKKEGYGCRPDVVSYTTVVHGLGIAGQVDNARKVFDEMISQGCLPSVATYNALIQVICKKGCISDAVSVFDEMLRKGYDPNSVTYNLVIRGLCHHGEMERAVEFMERMKCDRCEPNVQTYNVLIRYWCEEGEIEKCLELFHKMVDRGACLPNLDTYNVLISAMFVRKRSEDMVVAGKMVVEMVEKGYLPRKFMFNRILNGLLLTGNQGFAKELLRRIQDRYGRLHREIRL